MTDNTTKNCIASPATPAWRILMISLVLAILMSSFFFWPLPNHANHAIVENMQPFGESTQIGPVSPGDPLQLMYHFWMFTDMLAGNTPWLHNLYEFNTGDDAARYEPSVYYFPFSLFFAIGFWIDGHTGGWNLASVISIWLTLWLTFLLTRRYTRSDLAAWCCACLGLALPYRWMTLGGGSPTGFTMAWIPLLLYGIDRMVHNRSIGGGALAGLAILLASFADSHCFFFSILATPAWFLFASMYRSVSQNQPPARADIRPVIAGGALIAIFTMAAYLLQKMLTSAIQGSTASAGRTLSEVRLFTPLPDGLFSWNVHGVSEHIYIGYALPALVVLGLAAGCHALFRASNRKSARNLLISFVLLTAGIMLVIALALGANGPFGGQFFLWARDLVPPYRMIRQTAKIYCLLPSMIAVIAAFSYLLARLAPARIWTFTWAIVAVAGIFEASSRIHPRIGIIQDQNKAYAAVASHATAAGFVPRAVAVTLWPGESHFSSVYQHWGSLYHIRMVNGYFPFTAEKYVNDVFRRLESINVGIVDTAQREWLSSRGINYLIVHENLYPEKVSTYPIGYALSRLQQDPYFELLAQDGPVWAFRLLKRPREVLASQPKPALWPTTHSVEAEMLRDAKEHVLPDPTASGGTFVRLNKPDQTLTVRAWDYGPDVNNHWSFRMRGTGRLVAHRFVMNEPAGTVDLAVASDDWTWITVQMPTPETRRQAYTRLHLSEGSIDVDMAHLLAGEPIAVVPGESWTISADHLFHSGYSSPQFEGVNFDPSVDSAGTVLYGPKAPFPAGDYELSIDFTSPSAPIGTILGRCEVHLPERHLMAASDIIAGQPAPLPVSVTNNLPLNIIIKLKPITHAVTIRSITMKRIH
jgi:hypothetical protein